MSEPFVFNACACLGPRGTDPFCPCGMNSRGLVSSVPPMTAEQEAAELERLMASLRKAFPAEPSEPRQ